MGGIFHEPGRAWTMAAMLFVFIVVNFADKVALGLVAVPLMDELKFTPGEFGLIGSSFFWLFAISGVLGGFLSDHIKTKWFLLAMAASWSLLQLPFVYGASLGAFIAARVLLGIGEGPSWPVAVHAIYKWFPDKERALPVALFSQGGAIGLLLAGLTIPLATASFGWRASFVGLAIIGAVWALLWALIGKEGPIDPKATDGTAAVREQPLARVLADPTVWGNIMLHFVAYWALAGALTWLPAYFQKGLGFDNVAAGRMYGLVVATTIPLVLLSSWWSQRLMAKGWSSRDARGRFSSLWLILAGLAFVPLLVPGLPTIARVGIFAVALGFTPAIYALGPAMLAQVTPASRRGAVLAIDNSIASLAGVLAPIVSGQLIERYVGAAGYELGYLLTGALLIAGGLLGWFIVNPERSIKNLNA
jgi:sugar phosphate permease